MLFNSGNRIPTSKHVESDAVSKELKVDLVDFAPFLEKQMREDYQEYLNMALVVLYVEQATLLRQTVAMHRA